MPPVLSCVAVIPARWASSRLPGKPLADLAGVPMVLRVLAQARAASRIQRALVATDDPRIAAVVAGSGGEVVMTDPTLASGSDRVASALEQLRLHPDVVLNLQGDVPLVSPRDLDALIAAFDKPEVQVATGCRPLLDAADAASPDRVKVVLDAAGRALYFSRAPIPRAGPWLQHVGLYAFRPPALRRFQSLPRGRLEQQEDLEQLRLLEQGLPIQVIHLSEDCPSVDTSADLERLQALLTAGA